VICGGGGRDCPMMPKPRSIKVQRSGDQLSARNRSWRSQMAASQWQVEVCHYLGVGEKSNGKESFNCHDL
jgi:hypothetical protein